MKKILNLFLIFMKIGAFTFGGGYAMIPMIQREVVDNKKWISADTILEIVAIAETTPGPIAINAATFVGYKIKGVKGAIAATLGVVLPSFVIITVIALIYTSFAGNKYVERAFWGIRIGVLALLVKAMIIMFIQCRKSIVGYAIMLFAFILVAFFDFNVLAVIIISAVIGLVNQEIVRSNGKNDLS